MQKTNAAVPLRVFFFYYYLFFVKNNLSKDIYVYSIDITKTFILGGYCKLI